MVLDIPGVKRYFTTKTSQVLKSEPPPNDPRYSTTLDISYMAQDYAKQMLTIMNDLRKVKKFCNVVLTVNHTVCFKKDIF